MCPRVPDRVLVLEEREKPEYPEKNLSEQGREPTTNSTHIWRRRRDMNTGHIGGRRALSLPTATTLPPIININKINTTIITVTATNSSSIPSSPLPPTSLESPSSSSWLQTLQHHQYYHYYEGGKGVFRNAF